MEERNELSNSHDMKQNREYFNYPNILCNVAVVLLLWGLFTFFCFHYK